MVFSRRTLGSLDYQPDRENREAERQTLISEAWADPGGTALPILCTVRNLSSRGAKLELERTSSLPDEFVVTIMGAKRAAKVVWRGWRRMGVEFLKP